MLYNAHGDVVQLSQSDGTVTKNYTYDAFGVEQGIDAADANPWRYCGEYFDKETGNIYLRARYYNPSIGRFTQEDPAGDGLNWYTYCNNNPILFVDPSGMVMEANEWLEEIAHQLSTGNLDFANQFISMIGYPNVSSITEVLPDYSFFYDTYNAIKEIVTMASSVLAPVAATVISGVSASTVGVVAAGVAVAAATVTAYVAVSNAWEQAQSQMLNLPQKDRNTWKLKEVAKRVPPSQARVYQAAYALGNDLIKIPGKMTMREAIMALATTGSGNALTEKIRNLEQNRATKNFWGIYTTWKPYAAALAAVFGGNESPEVHGVGYYGHYHDAAHRFHVWYGAPVVRGFENLA